MLTIAVMNQSTVVSDDGIKAMLPALTKQWNRDLAPVWGVDQVAMVFVEKGAEPQPGEWWMAFIDDATQAGMLAYHDLTDEGLPFAKVFCKTIIDDKASVSVGASHELLEMAVDPWLNSAYQDSNGRFWAGEVADPVEDDQYAYDIDGVLVSDFVTPDWFGHYGNTGHPMSFKGNATAAFQILSGGYAQYFTGTGWQQETGAEASGHARIQHAPVGSRREKRARQYHGTLRRSRPDWDAGQKPKAA